MLHQYAGQQYSSINGHYSPLNSCSQLVQQTYSQTSKITEINDCDSEQSGYFNEEKFSPNESEESQTQRFEAKELSQSCESGKELVPNTTELYERTIQDKCDNETSQMIDEQNNNNVQKSQIKSEPFNYQKYTAASEETDLLPYIDLDMETIINAPVNENEEYKQKLQSTANEINKICDENESNFRLPGFHQAFGSTEIGRYVHQKDFIEQTATQSIIMHQSKTLMLQCQTTINGVPNGLSSPKAKSRGCSKRIKTPMETNATRLAPCWNYEHETDSPAVVCTPPNGGYYKRKDMRRAKPNQNCENGSSVGGYYAADEYYNNCPSPYYGGCSDYPNCEYYRYQQNSHSHSHSHSHSQYQNYNNSASYNTHSNYNMNNYTEEHSQRLSSYGSASSMSYSHNQNWRGERFFPYAEQFQSYRYRQGSSSPYYQQFVSSNQHIQSQQSFNYGYNSYPPVPNYNYF
ncbi:uncharacterized protein LOC135832466 isoform X2 [Planococcus citri]